MANNSIRLEKKTIIMNFTKIIRKNTENVYYLQKQAIQN